MGGFQEIAGLLACAFPLCLLAAPVQAAPRSPTAVVQSLCDTLTDVMKRGPALGFPGRVKVLDQALPTEMNLPFMARLVVGLPWLDFTAPQRRDVIQAFTDYSAAVYAGRFKSYGGEKFVVQPDPVTVGGGDVVVRTQLIPAGSSPVELDYRLHQSGGHWRIIDVLLNGTISQMAEQRSEFSSAVQSGGAGALAGVLRQKAAQLGS